MALQRGRRGCVQARLGDDRMIELGWLYEVIGALDELIQVSGDVLEPDEVALGSAMGWADLMNRFQDAISRANNAASDIPNLLQ